MPREYTPKVACTCAVCGSEFARAPSLIKPGARLYCSVPCRNYPPKVPCACVVCGKAFAVSPSRYAAGRGRCCSVACRIAATGAALRMDHTPNRTCPTCGEAFFVEPGRERKGRGTYCSAACVQRKAPRLPNRTCVQCGKPYFCKPSEVGRRGGGGKYCSIACRSKAHTGAGSPRWKGGATDRDTKSFHYKQWRDAVFARDNYTCQDCQGRGGRLQAHHIYGWADYPALRFVVVNGTTLCDACHVARHHVKGQRGIVVQHGTP